MGNVCHPSLMPQHLPDAEDLTFFSNLNIPWLKLIVSEIEARMNAKFSLKKVTKISWKNYFAVMRDIKAKLVKTNQEIEREQWHPAVQGYVMLHEKKKEVTNGFSDENINLKLIEDDYTEDNASSDDDSSIISSVGGASTDGNSPIQSISSINKKKYITTTIGDSQKVHPIYFGYSHTLLVDHKKNSEEVENAHKIREKRALFKAMQARSAVIDALEKKAQLQENNRLKKIEDLKKKFTKEQEKREQVFQSQAARMQGERLKHLQEKKKQDQRAAELAFEKELLELEERNNQKTFADKEVIREKRAELEGFKDLDIQEEPAAERLEQFARLEVHRCGDELKKSIIELNNKQKDFEVIKEQLEQRIEMQKQQLSTNYQSADVQQGKKIDSKTLELRSMVNVAETRLKEMQKQAKEKLEDLLDANSLLLRAVREKAQQKEFLPMFKLTQIDEDDTSTELITKKAATFEGSNIMSCNSTQLIIALIILAKGTFHEKFSLLIQIFEQEYLGFLDIQFITAISTAVATTLKLLKILPSTISMHEVENIYLRIFSSMNLNPKKDGLNEYETKRMFQLLLSKSELLMKLFSITTFSISLQNNRMNENIFFSAYQFNQLHPFIAYLHQVLDLPTTFDRLHYHFIQYHPGLQPLNKKIIHERAMNMGINDPLQCDYSRFIIKSERGSVNRVEPLDNGIFSNVEYYTFLKRDKAAIIIQGMIRSFLDRRLSDRAAKQMALQDAKQMAVKELKSKIYREFQKRENSKGVGKMKWDAEIRLKQAKLRASGQNVNRSNVVMILVEEAVDNAMKVLEDKFVALEKAENIYGLNAIKKKEIALSLSFDPALFDMKSYRFKTSTQIALQIDASENKENKENTAANEQQPETNEEATGQESSEKKNNNSNSDQKNEMKIVTYDASTKYILSAEEISAFMQLILGKVRLYIKPNNSDFSAENVLELVLSNGNHAKKGETASQRELRNILSLSESPPNHLAYRLRLLDPVLSEFKVKEILSEMPTKRLLLKYISSNHSKFMEVDFTLHFKVRKNQSIIINRLQDIEATDIEAGILRQHFITVQSHLENGTIKYANDILANNSSKFREVVELRKDANADGKSDQDYIREENERLQSAIEMHSKTYSNLYSSFLQQRQKMDQLTISLNKCEEFVDAVREFEGVKRPNTLYAPSHIRYNWSQRLIHAYKLSVSLHSAQKYKNPKLLFLQEIQAITNEFIEVAKEDAIMIIRQLYHANHQKYIPILSAKDVRGRHQVNGRGVFGQKLLFEAHNIVYKVCLDEDGIFNGSDEFASKLGGKERLGAQQFFQCIQSPNERLFAPLTATIDYFGYRVVAVSKLPISIYTFDDNLDITRTTENLVHGILKDGENFVNRSKVADKLLSNAARSFNLAEHQCSGLRDFSVSSTPLSAMLKVYRSQDDYYFVRNCWSIFPHEPPNLCLHLPHSPRNQSIFWRYLRPELYQHSKHPLSADTFTVAVQNAKDNEQFVHHSANVTQHLLHKVIPDLVRSLLRREFQLPVAEGFGISLTEEMHRVGVNMRHLGFMRALIWRRLPGTVNAYNNEKVLRTSLDLSFEVEPGEQIKVLDESFTIEETGRLKINSVQIPISARYKGDSVNQVIAYCGHIYHEEHTDEIRLLLLAEMIARTVKQLIRTQLRMYNQSNHACSQLFMQKLITDHWNLLCGSVTGADVYIEDVVYEALRERFGMNAIRASERKNLLITLRPIMPYIIHRMTRMFGIQLNPISLASFLRNPAQFLFTSADILQVQPVVLHCMEPLTSIAEAVQVFEEAKQLKEKQYIELISSHLPLLFLTLSDKRGGKLAINRGMLANAMNGAMTAGVEHEQQGPLQYNKFIKSMGFKPSNKSYIDFSYHEAIIPAHPTMHFSIELYFRVTGSKDLARTLLESGRYHLGVDRSNHIFVSLYQSIHTINLRLLPVSSNQWIHYAVTYDGTTLRAYVNSQLVGDIETEAIFTMKENALLQEHREEIALMQRNELEEKEKLKQTTLEEAMLFFQTREGTNTVKRLAQRYLQEIEAEERMKQLAANNQNFLDDDYVAPEESNQNQEEGDQTANKLLTGKQKRTLANKKAKQQYISELYQKNLEALKARYEKILFDLEENFRKKIEVANTKSYRPLRIGAALPSAGEREGSDYFHGQISCVSVFNRCLSFDEIRQHYAAGSLRNVQQDVQRLFALTTSKFYAILPEMSRQMETYGEYLVFYGQAICHFLTYEAEERHANRSDISEGKAKLLQLIDVLQSKSLADVIATIVEHLPRDAAFADIFVHAILALREINKHYLSSSTVINRQRLGYLPFEYGLIAGGLPDSYYEAASFIVQEVVRDFTLMFFYGEVDLRWITELRSTLLTISVTKAAFEDKSLKMIELADFMDADRALEKSMLPQDDDVLVLSQNLPLLEGISLSQCVNLTNSSLDHLNKLSLLRVLHLENCPAIDDRGLKLFSHSLPRIQELSLANSNKITDASLALLAQRCKILTYLNINNCSEVTAPALLAVLEQNVGIERLCARGIQIYDDDLVRMTMTMKDMRNFRAFDLSHCPMITDVGMSAFAQAVLTLKHLNIEGMNRLSSESIKFLTARSWSIETLNFADIFLVSDIVFFHSPKVDGRSAASEKMLQSLKKLILTDCVAITDRAIVGISERCRKVEELILRGCNRLTDASLLAMTDNRCCPYSTVAMCDTIRHLDISFLNRVTANGLLSFFAHCHSMFHVDFSGLSLIIDDDFLQRLGNVCPTIQSLTLSQCSMVTDRGVCCLVESLWLERLTLTGCHRITDQGIEVLAEGSPGLEYLTINKLRNITVKSIHYLRQCCSMLKRLECKDCPHLVNPENSSTEHELSDWKKHVKFQVVL